MSANVNSGSSPPVLTCRLTTAAVSCTPAERRAHAARVTAQRHHRTFFYVCVCLRRGFSSAEQRLELLEAECTNWAGSRIRVRRWVVRKQECLNMLLIRICDKWSHSGGAQSQRFLFCLFFYLTAGRDKFAVCDNMNACKRCIVPLYHICWIKSTSLSYYLDATVGTARLSAYKTVRKVVLNGTIIQAVNCTGRAIRDCASRPVRDLK